VTGAEEGKHTAHIVDPRKVQALDACWVHRFSS
jgi:hypothetical protein